LGIWATHFLKKSLPVIDGEVEMAGLENRVEVIRDEFGIPHIRAESDTDLYRALGFVSAQDRLWQMDLFRRVAHGRLAEIFGESSIDMDRRHRVFGFNRLGRELYENAREESRAICRAYTDGINRFIESSAGRLPFQFALLKYEPERWSPEDVYIVLMWQQWMVTFNWEGELAAVELIQKLGVEDALDLLTFAQSVGPTIIPESDRQYDASPSRIDDTVLPPEIDYSSIRFLASPQNDDEAQSSDTARLELPTQIYASNAWAVSGKQSASGMPILSNDPHIPHTLPSIWYMVHLSAPGIDDAAGITTLGVPMVVMGHTKHIAWSDTTTVADTQDLYVEKLNPDNPDEYLHKGKYRAFEIIKETIRYRGDGKMQSIDIEISLSEHGPIINDIANPRVGPETPLALKWAGSGGSDFVYGGHMLLKARGWDDFREALRPVATPVWNWVYADADGNIGYQLAGAIPIRKKGRGQLPVPGWIDDYEWDGHIPYDEMPRLFNPSTGYIVTANNRVTPDDYQYLISTKFAPRYRASRIEELINSKEKLSAPDMREIQMDLYSKRGERLRDYFVSACEKYPQPGPDFARAVELLREWNLETDVESVGASIFNESHATVARKIFGERLGPDLWKRVFRSFADLDDMIETESAARWFDDPATEAVETRDEALAAGVDAAARSLREFFKDGPDTWKWGGMHTLTFKHPLAVTDFMGRVLNVGPHPLGGAMSTINPGVYNFSLPDKPYEAWAGPSMRTVVDYADVNATRMVITLGQSEHPLSPHYSDQFEYWLKGDTIPIWKGAEVDAHAKGRLVLTPPK
jgi:penicillin amidase